MDSRRQTVRSLGVDRPLLHDAPEREPQMILRTAESVIERDIAVGSVDIVTPEQAGDPASGPDALGGPGCTRQLRFRLFIFGDSLGLGVMLGGCRVGGLLPFFRRLSFLLALGLLGRLLLPLALSRSLLNGRL